METISTNEIYIVSITNKFKYTDENGQYINDKDGGVTLKQLNSVFDNVNDYCSANQIKFEYILNLDGGTSTSLYYKRDKTPIHILPNETKARKIPVALGFKTLSTHKWISDLNAYSVPSNGNTECVLYLNIKNKEDIPKWRKFAWDKRSNMHYCMKVEESINGEITGNVITSMDASLAPCNPPEMRYAYDNHSGIHFCMTKKNYEPYDIFVKDINSFSGSNTCQPPYSQDAYIGGSGSAVRFCKLMSR